MFFICKFIELYEFLLFVTISMHVRIMPLKNAEKKNLCFAHVFFWPVQRPAPACQDTSMLKQPHSAAQHVLVMVFANCKGLGEDF